MIAPAGCSIRLIDLPYSIGAMVTEDEDGYASIYLNARYTAERQRKCLQHELKHLENDDIYNRAGIRTIEWYADEDTED